MHEGLYLSLINLRKEGTVLWDNLVENRYYGFIKHSQSCKHVCRIQGSLLRQRISSLQLISFVEKILVIKIRVHCGGTIFLEIFKLLLKLNRVIALPYGDSE